MSAYFLSSLLWTVAGLIVGYVIGSAGSAGSPYSAPRGTPVARSRTDIVVGFVLVILAVISVATMSVSVNQQQRVVECQTQFNEAFTGALAERTEAAAQERAANADERAAQRELLDVVLDPHADQPTRQAAIEKYRASLAETDETLAEADANRSENPLPVRPRCE